MTFYQEIPDVGHMFFAIESASTEFLQMLQHQLEYYKPASTPKPMPTTVDFASILTDLFGSDAGLSVITSVALAALLTTTVF